ncbi:MAG: D-alanyl-D-alanine carboxypeptidase [Clostridiales bacterium]|nr:D-alanyl-D-alanine carboxypeptidase [Clostridiales bacterium]MDY3745514.1 D-alanyl-D-alanine carboxypeptidase family protein [Lachnospiraceae bacterium]
MIGRLKKTVCLVFVFLMVFRNTVFAQDDGGSEKQGDDLNLQSPCALLMEASTGQIIYEKNADEQRTPASVTKVMTLLLIFEAVHSGKINMKDMVTTSAHAKSMGGSQVFLEEGEQQTVETLIKCIVIASGNDAAVTMAEYIGGTEDGFVAMMNKRASELGMTHTHFVDCCGLTESKEHYTSAKDIAIMTRELIQNYPEIFNYSKIWMEDITHVTNKGSSQFTLTNTNKLLRQFEGCTGLKTGSTSIAKYCLSATASKNGIDMIAVILAAPDSKTRFAEAASLLNYGYSRCSLYVDEMPESLLPVEVLKGVETQIQPIYEKTFTYLSTTGEDFSQITKEITMDSKIEAPFEKGTKIGIVRYKLGDKDIGSVNIVASASAARAGFGDCIGKVMRIVFD